VITAYTIGHTESYNKALVEDPDNCFKLGETEEYQGGWIWKTAKAAAEFIFSDEFLAVDWGDGLPRDPKKFSVYKVQLSNGWDDVTPVPGHDGIHHLKVDSRFTR
jgi:hypothetical protein